MAPGWLLLHFDVSRTIIHNQIAVYGSWLTSLRRVEDLIERLLEWNLRPEIVVTQCSSFEQAAEACRIADEGQSGKVCVVME